MIIDGNQIQVVPPSDAQQPQSQGASLNGLLYAFFEQVPSSPIAPERVASPVSPRERRDEIDPADLVSSDESSDDEVESGVPEA